MTFFDQHYETIVICLGLFGALLLAFSLWLACYGHRASLTYQHWGTGLVIVGLWGISPQASIVTAAMVLLVAIIGLLRSY